MVVLLISELIILNKQIMLRFVGVMVKGGGRQAAESEKSIARKALPKLSK